MTNYANVTYTVVILTTTYVATTANTSITSHMLYRLKFVMTLHQFALISRILISEFSV